MESLHRAQIRPWPRVFSLQHNSPVLLLWTWPSLRLPQSPPTLSTYHTHSAQIYRLVQVYNKNISLFTKFTVDSWLAKIQTAWVTQITTCSWTTSIPLSDSLHSQFPIRMSLTYLPLLMMSIRYLFLQALSTSFKWHTSSFTVTIALTKLHSMNQSQINAIRFVPKIQHNGITSYVDAKYTYKVSRLVFHHLRLHQCQ